MSNFIKINPSDISLIPGKKVLKAGDYAAFVESKDILKASEEKAKEQEEKATVALTGMMEQAMHDISTKIKAEKTEHILQTVQSSIKHLECLEKDLVGLVMSSVRKIIGDYSDEERIFFAVQNGLKLICQTQQVTIRVNPNVAIPLMERLKHLEHNIEFLEVRPDEKLNSSDCILESELGIINANIENQITNLERGVKAILDQ